MPVSITKKILSFLYPLTLKVVSNTRHQELKLQLYCNQLMLSTREAVYSFGTFYTPFRKSFAAIRTELPRCKNMLLLGTGLGSALKILQQKYHLYPDAILVDHDKEILDMSMNYMELNQKKNVRWHYGDAGIFLHNCTETFDLVCVDLFHDMSNPRDFKQAAFFGLCKDRLAPEGYCIYNMILNSRNEKAIVLERLQEHFRYVQVIEFKVNSFYICKATAKS